MGLQVEKDPDYRIPEDGMKIVSQNISSLAREAMRQGSFGDDPAEGVQVMTPHKIYYFNLRDTKSPDVLGEAVPIGWRYILFKGDTAFAAAEIAMEQGNQGVRFSRITNSSCAQKTVDKLKSEKLKSWVADDDYELRFLRSRDVGFFGLWLHSYANPEEKDFVIPLPPIPSALKKQRLSRGQFNDLIKGVAAVVVSRFRGADRKSS